jgi:hypothetical protein
MICCRDFPRLRAVTAFVPAELVQEGLSLL